MPTQDIVMNWEGGGDYLPFLKEIRANTNAIRDDSGKAQASIQADFKKTADVVKQTNTEFATSSKLVVAIAASAQQGLPALIKSLAQLGDVAEGVSASLSNADKANFKQVNDALREVAKNQKIVVGEVDAEKKARIDALVEAKKITAEEANLLKQVQAVVDAIKSAGTGKVDLKIGDPQSTADLLRNVEKLLLRVDELGKRSAEAGVLLAHGTEEGALGAEKLHTALEKSILAAEKAKTEGGEKLKELGHSIEHVAEQAGKMTLSLSQAEKVTFESLNAALRQLAAAEGIVIREIDAARKARISGLVAAKQMTAEEGKLVVEVTEVTESLKESGAVLDGIPDKIATSVVQTEALRAQYLEAKKAAENLSTTPGPELDAALAEAARLKKLLDETGQSIRNLNPGDKVRAFGQLGNAIAGGAQAVGGFAIALGTHNHHLQESIFRFQSALFAIQGARSFIKDFGDSFKDILRVLGLSTTAQVQNTAASAADVPVKTAQAVATTGVATASAGATTSIRSMTAALFESPLLPIVLILTAMGAAFALLSQNADEAKKSYKELLEEIAKTFDLKGLEAELTNAQKLKEIEEERLRALTDVKLGRANQADVDKADLEDRRKAEKNLQDARIQGLIARQEQERKAAVEVQNAFDKLKKGAQSSAKEVEEALKFLGLEEGATAADIEKAYDEMYGARVASAKQASIDVIAIEAKQLADAAARAQQEIDRQKELAEATRDIREQLASQIEAIEKQLSEKIRALEIGAADPRERLEREKQVADEELALLERNLRREIALQELRVKVGTKAFQDLSEAQKKARADAIIDEGGGQLSTKQAEAFAQARILIEQETLRKMVDLQLEFDLAIAEASGDSQVEQLAALDKLLEERAKKLKEAGKSEVEIAEDAARQVAIVQKKLAQDRLALDEQTQLDLLGAQLAAADGRPQLERTIQEKILEVKIDFAKKALSLIVDNGNAENTAAIAAAKRNIAELEKSLGDLKDKVEPFKLSDLFDLEGDDAARFNEAAKSIIDSAFDIVGQLNAADQLRVDAKIAATDAIIEQLHREGDELQAQLEKDQEANRNGLANNLDATIAAIAANKAAEDKALADKKRLVAEKQKLAKQQAIADTIQQSSSLLTAATSIFKEGALVPGGIFVAIGIVAAMVAAFLSLKNKITSITAPQGLRTGTKSVELKGHPDGVDTVPAMLTRGEGVIPVAQNVKHAPLVGAIIDDDFSKLTPKQLAPILAQINIASLLSEHGITVNEKATREVVTMNNTHRERVEKASAVDLSGVEKRLDALTAKVEAFRKQDAEKPEVTPLPDGSVRVKKKGRTEYIRP